MIHRQLFSAFVECKVTDTGTQTLIRYLFIGGIRNLHRLFEILILFKNKGLIDIYSYA